MGETGTRDTTELEVEYIDGDTRSWNERQTAGGMEDSWKVMEGGVGG